MINLNTIQSYLDKDYLKKEHILDIDDHYNTQFSVGLLSLARLVRNLIVMEPGTIPTNPTIGVGIEAYLGESLDFLTLNKLHNIIVSQVDEFIPNNKIKDIVIEPMKNEVGEETMVGVMINFFPDAETERAIFLFGPPSENSNKIMNEIII